MRTRDKIYRDDKDALEVLEHGIMPTNQLTKKTVASLRRRGHISCFRRAISDRSEWWMELTPQGRVYLDWLKVNTHEDELWVDLRPND